VSWARSSPSGDAGSGGGSSLSASDDKAQSAWQPLTASGVAAFARAPLRRLLLVQLIVALLAAGTVVWFLQNCWFPTIGEAIRALPAQGELRAGNLDWEGPSPSTLAEGRFLAIAVDLDHTGDARSTAPVQVEFGRADLKVYSLFGYSRAAYPHSGVLAFNRTMLWPWWGAWSPAILAIVAGSVVAGLMMVWACLATVYCLPVWLIGFFANRGCSLGGSWRLAGAALMPGALLMCAALFMYGGGALDLLRLAVTAGVHLVVGWIYLVIGPLCLPRHLAPALKGDPFA
jgi:hypothetical protein